MEFHPSLLNLFLWVLFVILQRHRCLGCADDERTALLEIKASVRYPDEYLSTWVEDKTSDYCSWNRIKCSNTTGCVSQLDLAGSHYDALDEFDYYILLNISLFLPFKDLQYLDMSNNNINGTKGHQGFEKLAKLKKLQVLDLSWNHFNTNFLEPLSELTSLRTLNLDDNHLGESSSSAEISQGVEKLAKLKKLQVLNLARNSFNISILEPLSELTSLRTLKLNSNHLGNSSSLEISQGVEKLAKLKKLQVLDLGVNNFNSDVLGPLSEITSLRTLKLDSNHLGNSSSSEISQVVDKLAKLKKLQVLDLGVNNFNSDVLGPFTELTSLRTLKLDSNHLGNSSSSEIFQRTTTQLVKSLSLVF